MRSDFRGALLSKIKMRSLPSRSLPALTRARNPRTERKGANATQSENQIRQLSDSGQKILLIDGLRIPPTTAKTHKNSATAHAHASDGSARRRTTVTATCVAALEYRMCSAFAVHAAQQCEPSVLVANVQRGFSFGVRSPLSMPTLDLPPPPRGLKGRATELATLAKTIEATAPTRLALVGAGGSGKSMLAAALA